MPDHPPNCDDAASQQRSPEGSPNDPWQVWDASGGPAIEPPEEWLEVVRQYAPQLLRAGGTGLILPDDASEELLAEADASEADPPIAPRPEPESGAETSDLRLPPVRQGRQPAPSPTHTPPDLDYPPHHVRHTLAPHSAIPELRKPAVPDLHIGALVDGGVALPLHGASRAQTVKARHAPSNPDTPMSPLNLNLTDGDLPPPPSMVSPAAAPLATPPQVERAAGAQPNPPQVEAAPISAPRVAAPIDPAQRPTRLAQDGQRGFSVRYADDENLHGTQLQPAESRWLALPTSGLSRTPAGASSSSLGHGASTPIDGLAALRANRLRREQQGLV